MKLCNRNLHTRLTISRDVRLSDGYTRNLPHEDHNLNMKFGSLNINETSDSAETYRIVVCIPCNEDPVMNEISCNARAEQSDLPSLHRMQQLVAHSPRAQAKLFELMHDIADFYSTGMHGP